MPASTAVVLDAGLRFVQANGEEIVTEGGKKEGDVVDCITIWLAGFREHSHTFLGQHH